MSTYNTISLLGQQSPGATSDTVLIDCTATYSVVVSSIVVCNYSETTADEFIICAGLCSGATSTATALYWKVSVPPKDTFVATIGITLANDSAGGSIVAQSTNGTLTYSVFGQVVPGVAQ